MERSVRFGPFAGPDSAIMPEVLPLLEQQFELAGDGAEFVLPRLANKNYRKFFRKYLERAGIEIWPALFNNLRKSAVTDAHDWLPPHVCDSWFGHSETIFKEHYAQVTEEHFKLVRQRHSKIPQFTPQQASEIPEKSGTAKKEDIEQDAQCPLDAAGYGKGSKAPENDGIDHWAMRAHKWVVNTGKNQRLLFRTHHRTQFRKAAII